jgi:uncharacterized membrane protein
MINMLPNWHPFFVHFTVALLIVATAMYLLSRFMTQSKLADQLTMVARWNLWTGAGFSLLTVATGWYAYNTVIHDTPSHAAMTEHRNWAMATFVMFLGATVWEYFLSRQGKNKRGLFNGLLAIAAALLLSTAWHGSELVYRFGLGVMSIPKAEEHTHTHAHEAVVEPDHKLSAGDAASTLPKKAGHVHAPGTPPHMD